MFKIEVPRRQSKDGYLKDQAGNPEPQEGGHVCVVVTWTD